MLEKIAPDFSKQAGLKGCFTNHSGKVTCVSSLFEINVDEQLIKNSTEVMLFALTSAPLNCTHCKYPTFYKLPWPKG